MNTRQSALPTILFLFNSSEYAVAPWLQDGSFNVVSVDYHNTDHSGAHTEPTGHTVLNIDLSVPVAKERVLQALTGLNMRPPSLVVSFAPCTDLAVSGNRHRALKLQKDPDTVARAVRMAKLASTFGCPYAVENPVSILATEWRKPDIYWHPCDFSKLCPPGDHPEFPGLIPECDRYLKKSCLWTGNGFRLPVIASFHMDPLEEVNPGWAKLGGKSARTKYIRSLTPRGFAWAVYIFNKKSIDRWA